MNVYKILTNNSCTEYYVKCEKMEQAIKVALAEEEIIIGIMCKEDDLFSYDTQEEYEQIIIDIELDRLDNLGVIKAEEIDAEVFDLSK